ncbi:hypothetical protein C0W66_22665 [Photobacterium kishitanii]|nr:hypothetical protein AYY23_19600 [Photobacterium kishitanii]PSW45818.1 hypothetical protein C0W66_22665 [Photobacterium kishitanii]
MDCPEKIMSGNINIITKMEQLKDKTNQEMEGTNSNWRLAIRRNSVTSVYLCWRMKGNSSHEKVAFSPQSIIGSEIDHKRINLNRLMKKTIFLDKLNKALK